MTSEIVRVLPLFLLLFIGISDLKVWTSDLVRTHQTAAHVIAPKESFSQFNEINAGKFDGYTYEDVSTLFPEEFQARAKDKLCYRYPQGIKRFFSIS